MTDFFTRVANKAIGVAPAIQPVIGSRYAPARFGHEAIEFELEVEADQIRGDSGESRRNQETALPPVNDNFQPRRIGATAPTPLADDLVPTPPPGVSESALPVMVQPVSPATQTPETAVVSEALPDSLSREGSHPRHESSELPKSGSRRTPLAAPINEVVDIRTQPPTRRLSERTQAQILETSLNEQTGFVYDENETRRVELEPDQPSAPSLNHRVATRKTSVAERHPQLTEATFIVPADKEERSPIIRVTIGRIDVRAVTPTPPSVQAAKPATPRVSLDEFLKQHNGRRR